MYNQHWKTHFCIIIFFFYFKVVRNWLFLEKVFFFFLKVTLSMVLQNTIPKLPYWIFKLFWYFNWERGTGEISVFLLPINIIILQSIIRHKAPYHEIYKAYTLLNRKQYYACVLINLHFRLCIFPYKTVKWQHNCKNKLFICLS